MAHIKDLHVSILQKVFTYFYFRISGVNTYFYKFKQLDGIHNFKRRLPPAAVCRVWRECTLPYVYNSAYLECSIKETYGSIETAQLECEWKSNIDLIVSLRLSSIVRQLVIQLYDCSHEFEDIIHVLDAFGFSSSHWRGVNVLHVLDYNAENISYAAPSSSGNEALTTRLTEYFGRHTPNIGNLRLGFDIVSNLHHHLSNKLVNLYINQLYLLRCSTVPITFDCHSFSSRLRYLEVGIASGVANRLLQLLAAPLQVVSLFDIPHNFAWWTFIGIAPGHIEFTNLYMLSLDFRQALEAAEESNNSRQVRTSTALLNIGCHKLSFPKLKRLDIYNSPFNDGAVYSMFVHSPLQTVIIQSSFKSVQHMDFRILFNAATIRFIIHSVSLGDYDDYDEFYFRLLSTPSNANAALLGMDQSSVPLPIPSTIEWTNLKSLTLEANIYFSSVIQVITQLPKLQKLKVENILDEFDEAGTNLRVILGGTSTQMPSIAANLKRIWIYSAHRLPLVFSLDVMHYLTILVHSLDEVAVPDLYFSDIKEFAAHHANAFPHLRCIRVRGTF